MSVADVVWPLGAALAQGGCWNPADGSVWFVDQEAGHIHRWAWEDGSTDSYGLEHRPAFILPHADRGFVLGLRGDLAFWSPGANRLERWLTPEPHQPANRLSNGIAGPDGQLWFNSRHLEAGRATGSLFRVDADRNLNLCDGPYAVTSGPAVTRDGRTAYHGDLARGTIWALDLGDRGQVVRRRWFAAIDEEGSALGMTTDSEDGLWVCLWRGGRILRYAPSGTVDRVLEIPAPLVSGCMFAGPDLDRLVVTTARSGLSEAELAAFPESGALFVVDPGARGWSPSPVTV